MIDCREMDVFYLQHQKHQTVCSSIPNDFQLFSIYFHLYRTKEFIYLLHIDLFRVFSTLLPNERQQPLFLNNQFSFEREEKKKTEASKQNSLLKLKGEEEVEEKHNLMYSSSL